jgi:hypothetical protein
MSLEIYESNPAAKEAINRSIFRRELGADGNRNPAFSANLVKLADLQNQEIAWSRFGGEFGFLYEHERYLANPQQKLWACIVAAEYARLEKTTHWLTGAGGTGKTWALIRFLERCHRLGLMTWYLAPSNVACEVVRKAKVPSEIDPAKKVQVGSVSTPHLRFELAAADGGWHGNPKWWPVPPNSEKHTTRRVYIMDEVFFCDARTLALSLACIPTGSIVIFGGDERQNRPVDGTEHAYWLSKTRTYEVDAGEYDGADLLSAACGHEINCKLSLSLLDDLRGTRDGRRARILLTKQHRVDPECSALVAARAKIFSGVFPEAGPGLTITIADDLSHAAKLAVARIGQNILSGRAVAENPFAVVTPSNTLSIRIGGEYNRATANPQSGWTMDFEGGNILQDVVSEEDLKLENALYFRAGQKCMVLVNDHRNNLHNGKICTYKRWNARGRYHVISVPQDGAVSANEYRLYAPAGKHSEIMRKPYAQLSEEYTPAEVQGFAREDQADACRGVLASPYALTCHRAQGSTYAKVCIIVPPWLGPWQCAEWLYVALSRARKHVEIIFAKNPKKTPEMQAALELIIKTRLTTRKPHAPNLLMVAQKGLSVEKLAA